MLRRLSDIYNSRVRLLAGICPFLSTEGLIQSQHGKKTEYKRLPSTLLFYHPLLFLPASIFLFNFVSLFLLSFSPSFLMRRFQPSQVRPARITGLAACAKIVSPVSCTLGAQYSIGPRL